MSGAGSSLSSAEVAALMEGLSEVEPDAPAPGDVRPFALGQEALRSTTRLAGLDRINERLARRLRTVVEPFARAKTQVLAERTETRRFEDWRAELPEFTSLSLYRLRPAKGGLLVVLEPSFIANMVDAFYGGSGVSAAPKTSEFTASEERLVVRLNDAIIEMLVEVWGELLPLSPVLASRETNAAYASLVRPEEVVVVQRFTVKPGNGRSTTISILYPHATLRPVEAELASRVHDDASGGDAEWRHRLGCALENVRLPVRSVLARPEMTVGQLLALKVGDVIPITLAPRVPLLVGARRVAEGTIGEHDGRAALMIETIGKRTGK